MPLPWECYPNVISLGAGVQSSTMALMASEGLIKPMPKLAIFADTQDEPKAVYEWLEWLEPRLAFPVRIIRQDESLWERSARLKISKNGRPYHTSSPPLFTKGDNGKLGMLRRHCTTDFKVKPLERAALRLARSGGRVVQWMGISTDEVGRVKQSRHPRVISRHPLIELEMSRGDCLEWMRSKGYPQPPRSACVYCPYKSDDEWIHLRDNAPEDFQKAVQYESDFQETFRLTDDVRSVPMLHRSLVPLSEVVFVPGKGKKQFVNECEGMCGV
jgi:hypothetical protein